MKSNSVAVACASLIISAVSLAADYTFPTVNGDLASPSDWGMDPIPGRSDNVTIGQAGKSYKVTQDVSFGNLIVQPTAETKINAAGVNVNLFPAKNPLKLFDGSTGRLVHLLGGKWDLNAKEWKGLDKNSFLYLEDGAVLTNSVKCWVASLAYSGARIYLSGASRIHCDAFCINTTSGSSGRLRLAEGSKVVVAGAFETESGTANYGKQMDTQTTVTGGSSLISCGTFSHGVVSSANAVTVADGGAIACSKYLLGSDAGGSANRLVMSDGTLTVAKDLTIAASATAGNGNGMAATNSTMTIGGAFINNCSYSACDFQNVKFSSASGGPIFPSQGCCVTMRFGGERGTQPESLKMASSYFPSGHDFQLVLDDGFSWVDNRVQKQMIYSTNCTLRVCNNAAYTSAYAMHVGYSDYDSSVSNSVEILSGGILSLDAFYLMGTGNRLVVSNGTLRASANGSGVLLGYTASSAAYGTTGAQVLIQGTTPKVDSAEALWIKGDVDIRFEIPQGGYADGYAPISASQVVFDTTATLTVDYAAFLAAGGGEVVLMAFDEDMSTRTKDGVTFGQWVKNQGKRMNLPSGCKISLVTDATGSRVVFRAGPPPGMSITIR